MTSPEESEAAGQAAHSVVGGEVVGGPAPGELAAGLVGALGQGRVLGREAVRLGIELARIALGRSALAPAKGDRRFADPAWTANPVFRRIGQTHLASAAALRRVVDEMNHGPRAERARLAVSVLSSAAAPATTEPGSERHPALDPAPGLYVRDRP